jgi:hypothetical protein
VLFASFMAAAPGNDSLMAATPGKAPISTAAAALATRPSDVWCSGWYQECYFCEGPTYEMLCDTYCYICPGDSEPTCRPTGWTCGGN